MKKLVVPLFLSMILFYSCNHNRTRTAKLEKLFIKTTVAEEAGSEMKKNETISEITSDYFEVSLSSQTDGGFHAQKDIIEPEPGKPFKAEFFQISQQNGTLIKFMTSTEFLNFMSAHGYELVDQIPNQYGGDYTFKRKK
jgi:hypothetical protein